MCRVPGSRASMTFMNHNIYNIELKSTKISHLCLKPHRPHLVCQNHPPCLHLPHGAVIAAIMLWHKGQHPLQLILRQESGAGVNSLLYVITGCSANLFMPAISTTLLLVRIGTDPFCVVVQHRIPWPWYFYRAHVGPSNKATSWHWPLLTPSTSGQALVPCASTNWLQYASRCQAACPCPSCVQAAEPVGVVTTAPFSLTISIT